jgi:hypothetical protein
MKKTKTRNQIGTIKNSVNMSTIFHWKNAIKITNMLLTNDRNNNRLCFNFFTLSELSLFLNLIV